MKEGIGYKTMFKTYKEFNRYDQIITWFYLIVRSICLLGIFFLPPLTAYVETFTIIEWLSLIGLVYIAASEAQSMIWYIPENEPYAYFGKIFKTPSLYVTVAAQIKHLLLYIKNKVNVN